MSQAPNIITSIDASNVSTLYTFAMPVSADAFCMAGVDGCSDGKAFTSPGGRFAPKGVMAHDRIAPQRIQK